MVRINQTATGYDVKDNTPGDFFITHQPAKEQYLRQHTKPLRSKASRLGLRPLDSKD